MKKKSSLLLLLILLVLALVFLFVAKGLSKDGPTPKDPDTTIPFLNKEASDLTLIELLSPDLSYRLTRDTSTNRFSLQDDSTFPLDQDLAATFADEASSIVFLQEVTVGEGLTLADYGLSDAARTLALSYRDGTSVTLKIGDYNAYAGGYYCAVGDGKLYVLPEDFVDTFLCSSYDLLEDELPTEAGEGLSSLVSVTLDFLDGKDVSYTFHTDVTVEGQETPIDLWKKTLSDGTVHEDDCSEEVTALYREIFSARLDKWVDYAVTGEDTLASYGLSPAFLSVTFTFRTFELTSDENGEPITSPVDLVVGFLIGNTVLDAESEERFFMSEGGQVVYCLSTEALSTLLGAQGSTLG